LAKPEQLTATPLANGIRLTWRGAGDHFRILRRAQGADNFAELATTTAPEYLDASAEFGKTYTYQVLAFAALAPLKEAQSDLSEEKTILYKDEFPPAAPAGLTATPSPASVELSWDANTEPDLAGYRVYRSTAGGAFEKVGDVNEIPAYSDHAVERGKTYRYMVTALDKAGNESGRSPTVEAALQ
jgi:fibronectin type 3 domain-containing protein